MKKLLGAVLAPLHEQLQEIQETQERSIEEASYFSSLTLARYSLLRLASSCEALLVCLHFTLFSLGRLRFNYVLAET